MDLDNLSDSDDNPPLRKSGGGMGVHVSAHVHDEDDLNAAPEDSLHGFALSGDVAKLQKLLASSDDLRGDVNSRDEYVCNSSH